MERKKYQEGVLGDRFQFVVHPFASSTSCCNREIIPKWSNKGDALELACRPLTSSMKHRGQALIT